MVAFVAGALVTLALLVFAAIPRGKLDSVVVRDLVGSDHLP